MRLSFRQTKHSPNARPRKKFFAALLLAGTVLSLLAPVTQAVAQGVPPGPGPVPGGGLTVTVNLNPTSVPLGQSVTVCLTDSAQIWTPLPSIDINGGNNTNLTWNGATSQACRSIVVNPINGFFVGSNSIVGVMFYVDPNDGTQTTNVSAPAFLTVTDPSSTATLTLTQGNVTTGTSVGVSVVTLNYSFTGQPAPIGFNYTCGNITGTAGTLPPSPTAGNFQCQYTGTGPFTVTLTANGNPAYDPPITKQLQVNPGQTIQNAVTNPNSKGSGGPLQTILVTIVGILSGIIRTLLYWFYSIVILPFINAAASIQVGVGTCPSSPTLLGTHFLGIVCPGWNFIRNFVNMLFILFLIVIAIATILRIQSYNYKRLLGMLIIMAILVNFSLVIAQAILKIADLAQYSFIGNSSAALDDFGAKLIKGPSGFLGLPDGVGLLDLMTGTSKANGYQVVAEQLIGLMFSFMAVVAMGAIAFFLMVRIVALWILLILSPFAYALNVLPATKKFAGMWWSTFIKYAMFTPIMFFFIKLAMVLRSSSGAIGTALNQGSLQTAYPKLAATIFASLQQLVILGFLFAGLVVAQKMSIWGAGAVTGFARTAAALPLAGAGAIGGAAVAAGGRAYSKTLNRRLTAAETAGQTGRARLYRGLQMLNPKVFREAMNARTKEKEQEAYLPAVGHVRDTLNRIMPTEWHRDKATGKLGLGQKSYYGSVAHEQLINHKKSEYEKANLSEEELVAAYKGATHAEDIEALGQLLQEGRHEDGRAIAIAMEHRDKRQEELMQEFIKAGDSTEVAREKAKIQAEQEVPTRYDAVDDLDTQTERLRHAGLTDEQIGGVLSSQDELAEADKKLRGLGNAVYEFDKNFRAANDFSGYKKLESEQGKTEMLRSLAATGVFGVRTDKMRDAAGAVVKDAAGKDIEVPVELDFKGNKIKDFDSLQNAIKSTEGGDKFKEENLKYELTGARKFQSALKRVERGDVESWVVALEPAAYMEQNEKGKFKEFTSYGKRMVKSMSSATINSLLQGRKMQARALKFAGLNKDEKTGQINADPAVTDYHVMSQLFELNADMASAILDKAKLDANEAKQLMDGLNDYYTSLGQTPPAFSVRTGKNGHTVVKT